MFPPPMLAVPRSALAGIATIVVVCLAVAGCGSSPAAPTSLTPARDSVSSVVNMSPSPGTALQLGQTVTFTGTPGYSLATADSGTVVMIIQDQANRILQAPGTQPSAAVGKGSGQVTLSQTISLPGEGVTSVRVFFALVTPAATSTNAAVAMTYPVH
jgi:hypothetical protein